MKVVNSYLIKKKTSAILPMFDQHAKLNSYVLQGNELLQVKMSPSMIVQESLLHYGSTLQGASLASKSVLGNLKMTPIRISGELEIYWFPSSSPAKDDCVWFSQAHVIKTVENDSDQTYVFLSLGHRIIVDMKKDRFDRKREKATMLRYVQSERNKASAFDPYAQPEGFDICKDPNKIHYEIKSMENLHVTENPSQVHDDTHGPMLH